MDIFSNNSLLCKRTNARETSKLVSLGIWLTLRTTQQLNRLTKASIYDAQIYAFNNQRIEISQLQEIFLKKSNITQQNKIIH